MHEKFGFVSRQQKSVESALWEATAVTLDDMVIGMSTLDPPDVKWVVNILALARVLHGLTANSVLLVAVVVVPSHLQMSDETREGI